MTRLFLLTVLGAFALPLFAADLEREARLAEQIEEAIFDGAPIRLQAAGHEFLAIDMAPEGEPRGAALILHGRGLHPDWEAVARPLRVGLAGQGWHTLSLQMPVLEKEAKYYDYAPLFPEAGPRIEAGMAHLRSLGYERVVLIAHSCGAHMALHWLEQAGDQGLSAYVGIGMGATDYRQPMARPLPLDVLKVPVLDLYGSEDYPQVQGQAAERWAAIRRGGHPASRQQVLAGADHYAHDRDQALLEAVALWLEQAIARQP